MKNFYKIFLIFFFMTTFALAEVPSIHAIFQTVSSGNLTKAHQMIQAVLREHPRSAKAHYVDAQILVRQGDAQGAKRELEIARKIEPNLSFVDQQDVIMLEQRITGLAHSSSKNNNYWVLWIILAAALLIGYLIWKNSSRRSMQSQGYPSSGLNPQNQNNSQTSQNNGSFGNRFFGGGILGGLASGLAMGAGFAAGERMVNGFMNSRSSNDNSNFDQTQTDLQNGGDQGYFDSTDNDFGINDSSSWDDGGSFSGDFGTDDSSW